MDLSFMDLRTRNFGCRMRRYTQNGIEMLSMENQKVKTVLALGKGADIVELVHKQSDTDVMFHSFQNFSNVGKAMTIANPEGSFLDLYTGGWQDLFPTYSAPTDFGGAAIGCHGEAAIYPWDCETVTDTPECVEVKLTLRTVRTPFLLEKHVKLTENDATLRISMKATNLGTVDQEVMWGQHPAFGYPFLDDSVELRLPGTPTVEIPDAFAEKANPFDRGTKGKWPYLTGADGKPVDMSKVHGPEDKIYMEYGVSDLAEGSYELVNRRKGLGVRMRFDTAVFPHLWIWALFCGHEEYPWFGRTYVFGVEPWSTFPYNYTEAKKLGTLLKIPAGKSLETELSAELFEA